jgi:3D (Asp-Asp-Asp) domain-containing protein
MTRKEGPRFRKLLVVLLAGVSLSVFPARLLDEGSFPPWRQDLSSRSAAVRAVRLEVLATAYTAHDEGMDGKGIAFTGAMVQEYHTVAVDPAVIPLGSAVFVPDFLDAPNKGWFFAEDTGSVVKGARIDIFIPGIERALAFGVKALEVYVVPPTRRGQQHSTRLPSGR